VSLYAQNRLIAQYGEGTITHLLTGITARSNVGSRDYKERVKQSTKWAKSLLAARVARPEPVVTEVIRVYDLCPPLGIEPMIRQTRPTDKRWIANGMDEIQRWFNGEIPLPIIPTG